MSTLGRLTGALQSMGVPIETQAQERPLVQARCEAEVAQILKLAREHGQRVVPVGKQSLLACLRPDALETECLLLSTKQLRAVIAYEPGDGTLTAQAGCSLAELDERVRRGGHRLTPAIGGAMEITLGGAIAAGLSGCDRERFGPLRHHLLGLRVALSDGSIVKSGGRLVKNVTGFDLHRLHCGARGTLGVILEASLRLFPEPEAEAGIAARFADLRTALQAASDLRALRLCILALLLEANSDEDGAQVMLFLAGRKRQLDQDLECAAQRMGQSQRPNDATVRLTERAWLQAQHFHPARVHLRVHCKPSKLAACLELLRTLLREHTLAARLLAQPGVGSIELAFSQAPEPNPQGLKFLLELRQGLSTHQARLEACNLPLAAHAALAPLRAQHLAYAWMAQIQNALDPSSTLASPYYPFRT